MKLAAYRWGGHRHVGVLSADGRTITPLALDKRAETLGVAALIGLLAAGKPFPAASGASLPLSAVTLEAPIPRPRRNIFCAGVNYRAHASEFARSGFGQAAAQEIPDHPVIFTKVPDCVIGPGQPIRIPERLSTSIDYEAELAVVIGKGGVGVSRSRAMEHVWGYTILNDVTARDLQRRHRQWLIGKSLDGFGPMGPWIVSADEIDGQNLQVRCWVNDELRQDASTRDLIFDIPTLIETISAGITLVPGDVIATGTPAGVGIGFDPPRFLKRGDIVRIAIEGIGELSNPVT
jgi:2-keto-4-pentenoate hydratase/2-oxohepta-3-ene-1,7-dioic acid hydratase in catechol pathway